MALKIASNCIDFLKKRLNLVMIDQTFENSDRDITTFEIKDEILNRTTFM